MTSLAQKKKANRLIAFSIGIIIFFGVISYILQNRKYQKENKDKKDVPKNLPFKEFINGEAKLPPTRTILLGMLFGIIFGFLDNLFLFIGIDSLEHLMPDNELIKAGLGNTFSDVIGAIVGTFIGSIGQILFSYDETVIPLWANTVGIFIGCLLGLYIPLFYRTYF